MQSFPSLTMGRTKLPKEVKNSKVIYSVNCHLLLPVQHYLQVLLNQSLLTVLEIPTFNIHENTASEPGVRRTSFRAIPKFIKIINRNIEFLQEYVSVMAPVATAICHLRNDKTILTENYIAYTTIRNKNRI